MSSIVLHKVYVCTNLLHITSCNSIWVRNIITKKSIDDASYAMCLFTNNDGDESSQKIILGVFLVLWLPLTLVLSFFLCSIGYSSRYIARIWTTVSASVSWFFSCFLYVNFLSDNLHVVYFHEMNYNVCLVFLMAIWKWKLFAGFI